MKLPEGRPLSELLVLRFRRSVTFELSQQVEYLRQKGVYEAQGYVFAPPLPANSYLALVEAMERPNSTPVVEPAASASAA